MTRKGPVQCQIAWAAKQGNSPAWGATLNIFFNLFKKWLNFGVMADDSYQWMKNQQHQAMWAAASLTPWSSSYPDLTCRIQRLTFSQKASRYSSIHSSSELLWTQSTPGRQQGQMESLDESLRSALTSWQVCSLFSLLPFSFFCFLAAAQFAYYLILFQRIKHLWLLSLEVHTRKLNTTFASQLPYNRTNVFPCQPGHNPICLTNRKRIDVLASLLQMYSHCQQPGSHGTKSIKQVAIRQAQEVGEERADGKDQRELLVLAAAAWRKDKALWRENFVVKQFSCEVHCK